MLTSVACKVAVVPVDHGQACAHIAGVVEGGYASAEFEGRERMSQIVDSAQWLDPGRDLRWLPLAVAEVVQVEVAAPLGWEQQWAVRTDGCRSSASSAIACSGTARRLVWVWVHCKRPFVKE